MNVAIKEMPPAVRVPRYIISLQTNNSTTFTPDYTATDSKHHLRHTSPVHQNAALVHGREVFCCASNESRAVTL